MVVGKSPVRTCIGCRQRVVSNELLRVVVAPDPASRESLVVVPDPRHRMSGRGAWVHPDPACVELAQRRRAFARALREPTANDTSAVQEYVTGSTAQRKESRQSGRPTP